MHEMTATEFAGILRRSAGGDAVDLSGTDLDTPFDDLGYDSLALLETLGQIERARGVTLSDDLVGELSTPRLFLERVNEHLAEARV